MKLSRVGNNGNEKPVLIDNEENYDFYNAII